MTSRFVASTDPGFFKAQQKAWSSPPIDGVGYISSADLLLKDDEQLRDIIEALERERYNLDGWRNHNNLWRDLLGLDSTHSKHVIDYGCGVGVEALQFARSENTVYIADIVESNVLLAKRVLSLYNFKAQAVVLGIDRLPPVDVFYCAGVLHHIPNACAVLRSAAKILNPDGEIRLMLYSDKGWAISTESPVPPVEEDVEANRHFRKFVSTFDSVGGYADWYNAAKLIHRFGEFLKLIDFQYIASDEAYCVAILKKKVT